MLLKKANMKINIVDLQPLNSPLFNSSNDFIIDKKLHVSDEVFADTVSFIKTAQKSAKTIDGNSPEFDLEAEIKNYPDSLFVKCFAIKADEMNDNGDYFQKDELKKAYPTFVGVPIFTNHENGDVNKARGKVIHSWWDESRNGIMIIARIDAVAYPQLARLISQDIAVGTSMGTSVHHSLCSICHNYSEVPDDYCTHIRERKTRMITSRNEKCNYHKHGPEESCPLCGCKKGETKSFSVERKAYEYNYGLKFIENSFVVNPACHSCGVTEVIDPQKFLQKVARIQKELPALLKVAESKLKICDDTQCVKIAGKQELDSLNQALDLVSSVSQSMLKQKAQIDLEFCSDLVEVLADLQAVTDQLTQQGYGSLESPQGETPGSTENSSTPPQPSPTAMPQQVSAPQDASSKTISTPAGNVATVTGPLAEKRINIYKKAKEIISNNKNSIKIQPRMVKTSQLIINPKLSINNANMTDLCFRLKEITKKIISI